MPSARGHDGLDTPWCQLGAAGLAVVGPVGDQTGQGHLRLCFDPDSDLGAVVARAARQAQVQGATPPIRQAVHLGSA